MGGQHSTFVFVFFTDLPWITYEFFQVRHLPQAFCFYGLCWDTLNMPVSLPPDKLADIQHLALSSLQTQYVMVCQVMSF